MRNVLNQTIEYFKPREKLSAALLYLILICVFYAPVVFFGKTLQPPLYYQNSVTERGVWNYGGRKPVNVFNLDLANTIYGDWPYNKFVGDSYKKGMIPLWNPYQALGVAVPEQYGHKVFFPYQILEDISPPLMWDFFILGRLFIAGFFTFLFLRLLGLSKISSFLGGMFYMFSGSMVWFINFEQLANVAMMAPILLWGFERLIQKQRLKDIAIAGIILGLTLLSGTPGVILYILLLAIAYHLFRVFFTPSRILPLQTWGGPGRGLSSSLNKLLVKIRAYSKPLLKISPVFIIGFMLAAPQILLFLDFLPHAYNSRLEENSGLLTVPLNNLKFIINPGLSETPTYFRIWPSNGVWDNTGGYIGVLSLLLIIAGLISAFSAKNGLRKYLLFFGGFGFFILLKNFGAWPFYLLGNLPFFNQVWSQRWAGPAWNLSLMIAAAIGFELLVKNKINLGFFLKLAKKIRKSTLLKFIIIFIASILMVWLIANSENLKIPLVYLKTNPALILSSIIIIVALLLIKKLNDYKPLIILAALEMWYWIPRGYDSKWMTLKLIPFFFGLITVFTLAKKKLKLAIVGIIIFVVSFSLIDIKSPNGFPERHNPFTKPPHIDFLKNQEGYWRIMGTDGVLTPNYASAFGISDLRYVDSLPLNAFLNFRFNNLHEFEIEKNSFQANWFTGMPELKIKKTESNFSGEKADFLESRKIKSAYGGGDIYNIRPEEEIRDRLPFYSLLGVRYILTPLSADINKNVKENFYFPLIYDKEIKIYENPYALPRIFIVHNAEYASSLEEAQDKAAGLVKNQMDAASLKNTVILEEKLPDHQNLSSEPPVEKTNRGKTEIIEYQPNKVIIKATAENPGILVLSDAFYPAWQAKINGKLTKIYRIDGLLRGVYVDKGESEIIFEYKPEKFSEGLVLVFISFAGCLLAFLGKIKRRAKMIIFGTLVSLGIILTIQNVKNLPFNLFSTKKTQSDKFTELALMREKISNDIANNINGIIGITDKIDVIVIKFVKNSYRDLYVMYNENGAQKMVLLKIIRRKDYPKDKTVKFALRFAKKYYKPIEENGEWDWVLKPKVNKIEYMNEKQSFLENNKLLNIYIKLKREKKIENMIIFTVIAYFEREKDTWILKAGEDKMTGKELESFMIQTY